MAARFDLRPAGHLAPPPAEATTRRRSSATATNPAPAFAELALARRRLDCGPASNRLPAGPNAAGRAGRGPERKRGRGANKWPAPPPRRWLATLEPALGAARPRWPLELTSRPTTPPPLAEGPPRGGLRPGGPADLIGSNKCLSGRDSSMCPTERAQIDSGSGAGRIFIDSARSLPTGRPSIRRRNKWPAGRVTFKAGPRSLSATFLRPAMIGLVVVAVVAAAVKFRRALMRSAGSGCGPTSSGGRRMRSGRPKRPARDR